MKKSFIFEAMGCLKLNPYRNLQVRTEGIESSREVYYRAGKYCYGFNGKELDNEIKGEGNSIDYGARGRDPRLGGGWWSRDPLEYKYPGISPYAFVANNPINAIDPDGRKIIFVNGYYNTGDGTMPSSISENAIGTVGGRDYWGSSFIDGAKKFFGDKKTEFVDGRGSWNSTGKERFNAGYEYAKANFETITAGMVEGETIKIVSHSMGAAYSEGMIKYLQEKKIPVEKVVHLSAADPSEFSASKANTLQLNLENDLVLRYKNFGENNKINGVNKFGEVKTEGGYFSDLVSSHADTKFNSSIWDNVSDLETIDFKQKSNTFSTPFKTFTGPSNMYSSFGNKNQTQFNNVNVLGTEFKSTGEKNEYKGPTN